MATKKTKKKAPPKKKKPPAWMDPNETYFTGPQALIHLQDQGYKIAKTKFYDDIKIGCVQKQPNGKISKTGLLIYANKFLDRNDGSDRQSPSMENKIAADTRNSVARSKLSEKKYEILDRLLVLKTEVEQVHTAKLAMFINMIDGLIMGVVFAKAIEMTGGNLKKLPEAREYLRKECQAAFAEYAKAPTFTIPKAAMLEAEELKEQDVD